MERHEVERELADAQDLLDTRTSGHLSYLWSDGTPRVVMVGCWWTGREFVVSTADTAPKVKALQARPAVALAIDAGGKPDDARALSVRGTASIEIVDGIVPEYLAMSRRSMSEEDAAAFEENVRTMYDRMARIAITPSWARFYDFSVGRMPQFLLDLAAKQQQKGDA